MKSHPIIVALCILLIPTSIFAKENNGSNEHLQSLEEINQNEAKEEIFNASNDIEKLVTRTSEKKYRNCLKAFGHNDFCQCLAHKTPVSINFYQYVIITTNDKEELGYSVVNEETKGLIDNALKARKICVDTHK